MAMIIILYLQELPRRMDKVAGHTPRELSGTLFQQTLQNWVMTLFCSEICFSCPLSLHIGLVVPCIHLQRQTDPYRETSKQKRGWAFIQMGLFSRGYGRYSDAIHYCQATCPVSTDPAL